MRAAAKFILLYQNSVEVPRYTPWTNVSLPNIFVAILKNLSTKRARWSIEECHLPWVGGIIPKRNQTVNDIRSR